MSFQKDLVAQFHKPDGGMGQLAGWVMAHRRSNRRRNERTLELLDLQQHERVLEIGFADAEGRVRSLIRGSPCRARQLPERSWG